MIPTRVSLVQKRASSENQTLVVSVAIRMSYGRFLNSGVPSELWDVVGVSARAQRRCPSAQQASDAGRIELQLQSSQPTVHIDQRVG